MTGLKILLWAAALTLLVASVESSSGGSYSNKFDLSGQKLTDLYNQPVYQAERVRRPLEGYSIAFGVFSHTGVRVTLENGDQWLIHKGNGYRLSSQTVVTDARHMSSAWEVMRTRNFKGTKMVSDFVSARGPNYDLIKDNCHDGSCPMVDQ